MRESQALVKSEIVCLLLFAVIGSGCASMRTGPVESLPLASATKLPFERLLPGPVTHYEVMRADSGWGHEYILSTSHLSAEGLILEGRNGRSCADDKPWLMLRSVKTHKGLAALLAYSGNWRIEVVPEGKNTLFRIATLPETLRPFTQVNDLSIPGKKREKTIQPRYNQNAKHRTKSQKL